MTDEQWAAAPADLTISRDEVHVWQVPLDLPDERMQSLQRMLAADELHRAKCFRFQKDRARFVAGRGLLRTILGRYLGASADRLYFCYNAYGKPALAPEFDQDDLVFNLSHSDALAVLVVTRNRAAGIDIERIKSSFACDEIAEHFFSPREMSALRALPAEVRHEAFFRCWTCKEAYVKARGEGLSLPLEQFDVCVDPAQPAKLVGNRLDPGETSRWSFVTLSPTGEYKASVAVQGHGWQLKCWQWRE